MTAEGKCELCQVPGVPLDQDASAHLQDLGQYARRGEMTQQVIGSTPYATCPFIWPASNPLLPPSPPFRPRLSAQPPSPDHVDACPDSMAY